MILKIRNPKTESWVFFDHVERASIPKWGAYVFVLDDPPGGNERHLRLHCTFDSSEPEHSPDFLFLDEEKLIESMKKSADPVPARIVHLIRKESPSVEIAWMATRAFLLNDEGKTIERL